MSRRERRQKSKGRWPGIERPISRRARLAAGAGLGLGATFAIPAAAQADVETFTVNSTADDVDAGGCEPFSGTTDCTLREAVAASDDTDTTDLDTITFAASVTGTITLGGTQLPEINEPLYINGPGAGALTVDANAVSRILFIDVPDAVNPHDVTVAGLTLTRGYSEPYGGAIYNEEADLTVRNAVVSDSYTTGDPNLGGFFYGFGGGIYSDDGSTTIEGSTISGNHTEGDSAEGGGVWSGGPTTITNSTISDNNTDGEDAYGGGVWSGGPTTITNSTISGNDTDGENADGGGLYVNGGSANTKIYDSTISDNYTEGVDSEGGGLYINASPTTIERSTLSGNATYGYYAYGGGLHFRGSDLTISRSTLSGNYTYGYQSYGGAVYIDGATATDTATIEDSTVSGNSTAGEGADGGGIYSRIATRISRSTVSGNSVEDEFPFPSVETVGGGVYLGRGNHIVEDSTISGNSATGTDADGGGLSWDTSGLTFNDAIVRNTIIASNSAGDEGPDWRSGTDDDFAVSFSLVENTSGATFTQTVPGSNIFGVDPLLGPLAPNGGPTRTHALVSGSPAIDKGNAPGPDQRGFARPVDNPSIANAAGGNGADIGAFEVQAPVLTTPLGFCAGQRETSASNNGTPGRDVIVGTSARDVIRGLGGNDIICGGGGNDLLVGGGGKDKLLGQAGKDKLKGGPKKDVLKGGGGKDTLIGGGGPDKLNGGPGADIQRQ